MSDLALEIHDLQKHFGRTEVWHSVDLAVPVDEIFGFLGPNGAGKSTTMKIAMGLLRPSGGRAGSDQPRAWTSRSPPRPSFRSGSSRKATSPCCS